jgi:hypothetical protein
MIGFGLTVTGGLLAVLLVLLVGNGQSSAASGRALVATSALSTLLGFTLWLSGCLQEWWNTWQRTKSLS